jgi:hypothetical protein
MLEELYEEFRKFSSAEVPHFHKLGQQRKAGNENASSRPFKYCKGKDSAQIFNATHKQVHQPLNDFLRNRDSSARIGKWAMELSEHVIDFEKRTAIKSKVLADFIEDCTEPSSYTKGTVVDTSWQVHCDRVWGVSGVGAAAILKSPSGIKLRYTSRL